MPYDDHNDDDVISNLDPSVAALLEPCDDPSQMRTRMALMKLQQARIRGNSDYAAKIMDLAIEEGARDRQAWTLLDEHIQKLEEQVNNSSATANNSNSNGQDSDKEESKEVETEDNGDQDDEDSTQVSSEEVKQLKKEVKEEKERAKAMEDLLIKSLQEELEQLQKQHQAAALQH